MKWWISLLRIGLIALADLLAETCNTPNHESSSDRNGESYQENKSNRRKNYRHNQCRSRLVFPSRNKLGTFLARWGGRPSSPEIDPDDIAWGLLTMDDRNLFVVIELGEVHEVIILGGWDYWLKCSERRATEASVSDG